MPQTQISFYFVIVVIWLCIRIVMVYLIFPKGNGYVVVVFKVPVDQSIVYCVRTQVVHSSKPIEINGRMLYVHCGFLKFDLQIPFFWSQLIRLKPFRQHVGVLRAIFVNKKELVPVYSVNEIVAMQRFM